MDSPFWNPGARNVTGYNRICIGCHDEPLTGGPYDDLTGPFVMTHSPGGSAIQCIDCHNNHDQDQIFLGKNDKSAFFLATATGDSVGPGDEPGTTKIFYSNWSGSGDWSNPENVAKKTGELNRGAQLVPERNSRKRWQIYMILDVVPGTTPYLVVKGIVPAAPDIGIFYGQLINRQIYSREVRFWDKAGSNSFVNAGGSGICQVCHIAPDVSHWTNDGGGTDHNPGTNCMDCHRHADGFAHGGGTGTGCESCHGHDAGYEYIPGEYSQGKGSVQSHSTHTENDSDDLKGPQLDCDGCHDITQFPYFNSGTDSNGDGRYNLSETDVCDACHSAGGSYDGLDDPVIGAKHIWSSGAYAATDDSTLRVGKEKWCATCHDEDPSVIQSITAPNVIGDEDGPYSYGTGWGYYMTGHGLAAEEPYPYKGGIIPPNLVNSAAKPIDCDSCHDYSTVHIDGLARTFDDGDSSTIDPSVYRQGYRLKMVPIGEGTGASMREPLLVPWPQNSGNPEKNSRLCFNCHDPAPFINHDPQDFDTNFATWMMEETSPDVWENIFRNRHEYHLVFNSIQYPADWNGVNNSNITCVNCHNVHGSTRMAMVRDGKLTGREEGLQIWYKNDAITTNINTTGPLVPEGLPLAASDGTAWIPGSAKKICVGCHGTDTYLRAEDRTPYQNVDQAPMLTWTEEYGYVSDGVSPDAGISGNTFVFRVRYTDTNNDAPASIQVWVDLNDDGDYDDIDEKQDMTGADLGDANYTDGRIYSVVIPLYKAGDNTFDYRFYASDGVLTVQYPVAPAPDKTVTVTNNRPILSWTAEPYFGTDGVHPNTGGLGSDYEFRITYTDLDTNECPAAGNIQVWIDLDGDGYETDEKHDLAQAAGGDNDCTNGEVYTLTQQLSISGVHNYRFYASDGIDPAIGAAGPLGNNVVNVSPSANNPPLLEWNEGTCLTEGVKPTLGAVSADFVFSVKYTDPDGGCPAGANIQVWIDENNDGYDAGEKHDLALAGGGDGDCTNGEVYTLTRQLSVSGSHNYRFYAWDGTGAAFGEATSDSTVTVVNAEAVYSGGSIQAAIDAARSTNKLTLVYEGTYNENLSLWEASYSNSTVRSVCGPDVTIISNPGNVIFLQNISGVMIDGFGITGGTTGVNSNGGSATINNCRIHNNNNSGGRGGGLNAGNASSILTVANSEIYDNTATEGAGATLNAGFGHSFTNTAIHDNQATSGTGGAVFTQNGSVTFTGVILRNNTAATSGGAVYSNGSDVNFIRSTIIGNIATTGSSGVIELPNSGVDAVFENCIVANNRAVQGGVSFVNTGATFTAINSTFAGNQATGGNGGALYNQNATSTIRNSIIWNNTASGLGHIAHFNGGSMTITDTVIASGNDGISHNSPYFTGNITPTVSGYVSENDPNFVDAPNGDYHIQSTSDAIDNASAAYAPPEDIDGDARPQGAADDIGADEYSTAALESEAPVVTGFTVSTPSTSLYVDVTLFTATDNVGITGYNISTSAVQPALGGAGWTGAPPVTYQVVSDGTYDLYPWARDAAGNVSAVYVSPQTIVVDSTGPDITTFIAPAYSTSLAISITSFTATDLSGVAGYQITTSSTPPSAGGGGWSATRPAAYTVGSEGTYTLYPWAKDALNNVSSVFGSPRTVVVDMTPPQVSGTVPLHNDTGVTPNNNVTINWDEAIDCSTVTTLTVTINPQSGGWVRTFCSAGQAIFTPDSQSQLTSYSVTVSTSVKDLSGNAMASSYVFSYETSSGTNTAPVLSWATENCLINGVKPRAGSSGDNYEFKIQYTDEENQCPASGSTNIQVWVDLDGNGYEAGEKYNLTEVSSGDTDCTPAGGGKLYSTTRTLSSSGNLNYRFYASDGIDAATGIPVSDAVVIVLNSAGTLVVKPGETFPPYYGSIDAAWDAATSNSTILVYPNSDFTAATYTGKINHWSNQTNITLMSACGADLTIASGGGVNDDVFSFQGNDGVVIDGFTVTGATSRGVYSNADALTIRNSKIHSNPTGVWLNNTCNPTVIENSVIYDNTNRGVYSGSTASILTVTETQFTNNGNGSADGGAIYIPGGSGHTFTNVTMTGNDGNQGGAVYCNNCGFTIDDSTVNDNTSDFTGGGGIFLNNSSASAVITDTFIQGNSTTGQGGAVYCGAGYAVMTNVMMTGNRAAGDGGALYHGNGYTDCTFCTISGNYAGGYGGGAYIGQNYTSTFRNSIIYNNDALNGVYKQIYTNYRWTYADVYNTLINQAPGSSTTSPQDERLSYENMGGNDTTTYASGTVFASRQEPASAPTTAGDYQIKPSSPCVDTGSSSYTSDHDIYGDSRPYNSLYDMGADEYISP